MALEFKETGIPGLLVVDPKVFGDERGFFMESYSARDFLAQGIDVVFVQDNHSKSRKGVFRGFHFQTENVQTKLIRVISGSVLDFAIDLRKSSPTYRKCFKIELSEANRQQLLIPKGFAHGFLTLEDDTEFVYKCDDFYNPSADAGIAYDDPALGIDWEAICARYGMRFDELVISEKDKKYPTMGEFHPVNPF